MNSDISSVKSNLHDTFHFYITLLRLGAVRIKVIDEPKVYPIYEVVQLFSYYSVKVGILVDTIQNTHDLEYSVTAIRLMLTMCVITWIQLSLRFNIEPLERLMILTTSYNWEDQPKIDPETGDATMSSLIIKIKKVVKYSVIMTWVFHGTSSTVKVATGPYMVYRSWYPFKEFYASTFVILNSLQMIASITMVCAFFGFLGVYATLVCIACSQLDKLRSHLLSIRQETPSISSSGKDLRNIKRRITDCIQHHQSILEFCQLLENTMNLTLCGLFLIILITMCFSAFSTVTAWGNVPDVSDSIAVYLIMTGNIFTICWFGNQLTEKIESIREAAFGVDWIGAPVPLQRCVMFMMAAANQKFTLTAGKFVPISNETLMTMVNQSMSFFMFLLQVKDKNIEQK